MQRSRATGSIFCVVTIAAVAALVTPGAAQQPVANAPTSAERTADARKITAWIKLPIFAFRADGAFFTELDSTQLPPLPLVVGDDDFDATRTRIRLKVTLASGETPVYVDTHAVTLSREPPAAQGSVTTHQPPALNNRPRGATYGTVASKQSAPQQPQVTAASVTLNHPAVVDTATLKDGNKVVVLFGIEGMSGFATRALQDYLTAGEDRLNCQAQSDGHFICLTPEGTDIAEVALANGAAKARQDAPASYRQQEEAAQGAGRGLWVDLGAGLTGDHPMAAAAAVNKWPRPRVDGDETPERPSKAATSNGPAMHTAGDAAATHPAAKKTAAKPHATTHHEDTGSTAQ